MTNPSYSPPPIPPQPAPKKPKRFGWIALIIATVSALVIGSCTGAMSARGGATTAEPGSQVTVTAPAKPAPTVTVTAPAGPAPTVTVTHAAPAEEPKEAEKAPEPEKKPEPKPEDKQSEVTKSQEQALRSAESYLDYSAFSKKGLAEQLEYEGFSKADAEWAADQVDADWNEQAVRSAISYLEYSAFSESELADQLEHEGFTAKQAKHGASEAYKQ